MERKPGARNRSQIAGVDIWHKSKTERTDSVWLMVTSSTLVLKCGDQGGSTTGRHGSPMVGEGRTKSMLGGGT